MKSGLAIETLYSLFGDQPFEIRQLNEAQVEELAELIDDSATTDMGRRRNLGRWLTSLNGHHIFFRPGHYGIAVLRWANRSVPGLYRISGRIVESDHAPPGVPKGESLLTRLFSPSYAQRLVRAQTRGEMVMRTYRVRKRTWTKPVTHEAETHSIQDGVLKLTLGGTVIAAYAESALRSWGFTEKLESPEPRDIPGIWLT